MSLKTNISPKIVSLVFGVLIVCFAVSFYIFAWDEPTSLPPGDNASMPLNVSVMGQIKDGGLVLNYNDGMIDPLVAGIDALVIYQNYFMIASIDTIGVGPVDIDEDFDPDCDSDSERGRMILDYSFVPVRVYICKGTLGWGYFEI